MAKAQLLFWKGDQSFREYIVKARKEDRERTNRFMTCYWIEELPLFHPLLELNTALTKIDLLIKEPNFKEALINIDILLGNKLLDRQLKEVVLSMKIECLLSLKKYDDAKNIIDTLIKFSKHYPMAYIDLAIYYKYIKDFNNALKSINKAIMLGEKHKQLHWQSYQLKSEILKELGDTSYTEYIKKAEITKKKNLKYLKTICKEKDYNQYLS
jgi:tetratricopeptide (TPR) repeat protein